MRKIIAAINMTLDGFCNHDADGIIVNDEIHEHYNELLRNADALLYGRKTYELMENYWPAVVKEPTGNKPIDDFGVLIDNIDKIVFSRTLEEVNWKNSTLKKEIIKEEILGLKQQAGKNICAGSPSLIVALTELGLVDEYQLCIQPVILGKGLPLFKNISNTVKLQLLHTKTFDSGPIILYYGTVKSPS